MREICLTQNKIAFVDDEDFDRINAKKWQYDKESGYAIRRIRNPDGRCQKIRMHREIMFFPEEQIVDHENRNRLDNQKGNLRIATERQNSLNRAVYDFPRKTSKYKGVYWSTSKKKWVATITVNRKKELLGYFDEEVVAAEIYDDACVLCFGDFAAPNFRKNIQ